MNVSDYEARIDEILAAEHLSLSARAAALDLVYKEMSRVAWATPAARAAAVVTANARTERDLLVEDGADLLAGMDELARAGLLAEVRQ